MHVSVGGNSRPGRLCSAAGCEGYLPFWSRASISQFAVPADQLEVADSAPSSSMRVENLRIEPGVSRPRRRGGPGRPRVLGCAPSVSTADHRDVGQVRRRGPLPPFFTSSIFLSANSNALINAGKMMAVPCWSSCIKGIISSSFSLCSM